MSETGWWGHYNLRFMVYERLRLFLGDVDTCDDLTSLLGYSSPHEMWEKFSARDVAVCQKLLGPNGKTVYKMLKARNGK